MIQPDSQNEKTNPTVLSAHLGGEQPRTRVRGDGAVDMDS